MYKKIVFTCALSCIILICQAQNEIPITQEFNLTGGITMFGQSARPSASAFNELGTGYDLSAGYTMFFDYIGITFQYYYKNNPPNIDNIQEKYGIPEVTSGNYSSNGFMTGIVVNMPMAGVTGSSVYVAATGGAFVAHLPDQKFIHADSEFDNYYEADAAGFVMAIRAGYKMMITDQFGLGADLGGLFERASFVRESFGSIEDNNFQYYNWKLNYPEFRISFLVKL